MKTCGRCHHAIYCSKECNQADWVAHQRDCHWFRGLRDRSKIIGNMHGEAEDLGNMVDFDFFSAQILHVRSPQVLP